MTRQFASTFDGRKAVIGNLELMIDQQTLAEATSLSNTGEEWFKGKYDKKNFHWNHFFKRNSPNEFGKGLPLGSLKKKHCEFMFIILDYITCEGRYSLLHAFHIKLLMVSEGRTVNLPYFLLKSLSKMSRAYQKASNPQSLFHHGLICIILKHELVKYHISWDRFLSKIQLSDDRHMRSYSLPCDLKNDEQPQVSDKMPENKKQFDLDLHDQSNIEISFADKRNARLISRLARNQARKKNTPELVDLDKEEIPTSSVARVVIDLNQSPLRSPSPLEAARAESENESEDKDYKHVVCHDCLEYKSQVQSLKDDISELHKEILKLRRQKRLMTENYELEVVELNKKIKNNEPEQRFNTSSINNIIINSEGKSSKNKEIWKYQVCIFLLFVS